MTGSHSVATIITTYNSRRFIHKTIHSVLEQSYKPMEIVVVDDGSTDDTLRIVEGFSNDVKVHHHPDHGNLGVGASRNLGIKRTNSDLIAFMDHDDLWYADKIMLQVEVFRNHPKVGLVHTNGYVIDEHDNVLYDLIPKDFQEPNRPDLLLLDCYIRTPSAVMVRRDVIDKAGMFDDNFLISCDHDLWIRLSEVTHFHFLRKHLLGYRNYGGQESCRREMWEEGFDILEKAVNRYPYGSKTKRKRLAVLHYRLGMHDLRNGDFLCCFKNLLLAGMLDPFRSAKTLFGLNVGTRSVV